MANISLHYSSRAPLAGTFAAFSRTLRTWRHRAHDRRELAKLDHRTLHDLGISEASAHFEANKPFWRE